MNKMDRTQDIEKDFTRMVLSYKSTIYAVCYMFSKDKDEIEDLFQDILLRLWNGCCTFRGTADVRTWINRVSLNSCIDQQRKRRRIDSRVGAMESVQDFVRQEHRCFIGECIGAGLPREILVLLAIGAFIGLIAGAVAGVRTHNRIIGIYESILLELEHPEAVRGISA